jgi:hypothetical protein
MPSFEQELAADICRFEASVASYRRNPRNDEAAEMLCIASRSVTALFQEVCVWDDRVNENIRQQVISVLEQAQAALSDPTFSNDNPRTTYMERICDRISAVRNFEPEHATAT